MLPLGFMWVLKIFVYVPYPVRTSGNILPSSALPIGGIYREMKAGDSGKWRVRINRYFLIVRDCYIPCVWKQVKGMAKPLTNFILSNVYILKHGLEDFVLCSG